MNKFKEILNYKKSFENRNLLTENNYQLKVLVINSGYFLIKEVSRAFIESKDKVQMLDLYNSTPISPFLKSEETNAKDNFLEKLLNSLIQFKPDIIFTVNMIGFDTEGKLLEMLDELDMVVVNWFVDTPLGILGESKGLDRKNILSFTWEKDYIKEFNKNYSEHKIEYLPYGTMYSGREPFISKDEYKTDISFVGNSMFYAAEDWEERYLESIKSEKNSLDKEMNFFGMKNDFISTFSNSNTLALNEDIIDFFEDNKITTEDSILKTYFMFLGSNLIRKEIIPNIDINCNNSLIVYGDENWNRLNLQHSKLKTYLDYYKELPFSNASSKISLNLTSPQMRTGLNQRIYDTSATGGFLLTDYREDFFELFESFKYKNDIVFKSKEELLDKIKFYLNNETIRLKVIDNFRGILLADHRYINRIIEIKKYLIKHFGNA